MLRVIIWLVPIGYAHTSLLRVLICCVFACLLYPLLAHPSCPAVRYPAIPCPEKPHRWTLRWRPSELRRVSLGSDRRSLDRHQVGVGTDGRSLKSLERSPKVSRATRSRRHRWFTILGQRHYDAVRSPFPAILGWLAGERPAAPSDPALPEEEQS